MVKIIGHGYGMLAQMGEDQRACFERLNEQPLPKLSGFYRRAIDQDENYDSGSPYRWQTKHDEDYPVPTNVVDYTTQPKYSLQDQLHDRIQVKITGWLAQSQEGMTYPADRLRKNAELAERKCRKAIKDLRKIGVNADIENHWTVINTEGREARIKQVLLTLPRLVLEGDPKHPTEVQNTRATALMLAYLLYKKEVTEQDVKNHIAVSQKIHCPIAFGWSTLELAQSRAFQNDVRKGLGEPLLPEKAVTR